MMILARRRPLRILQSASEPDVDNTPPRRRPPLKPARMGGQLSDENVRPLRGTRTTNDGTKERSRSAAWRSPFVAGKDLKRSPADSVGWRRRA